MSELDQVVEMFGHNAGIEGLKLSPKRILTLHFEHRGDLYVEEIGDTVFMYFVYPVDNFNEKTYLRALSYTHYSRPYPFIVDIGFHNKTIGIILVRIPLHDMNLPTFERAMSLIKAIEDGLNG